MNKKKLISFDLDCTLIDPTYNTFVWEIGIPQLYAKKYQVSLSEAASSVISEYQRVGDGAIEWYDIAYWFRFFELPGSWQDLMEEHRDKVRLFPEVKAVMEDLAPSYHLIIISNAAREFVEIETKETEIANYFVRTFSTTSDFGQVKKTPECYEEILGIMGTKPSNAIHVGDHYEFDYLIPKQLGIEAYYLDRDGKKPEDQYAVKDLKHFAIRIKNPLTSI
ncbi:MAG: HAD family hydrolase [Deltaproteobacteria bacterium]|nr:MAG: HAD family hydrolase [Deltaproteobacteria bacterium]